MEGQGQPSGGIYISAPGKIILFGEHAVVYGRTAVAGSIDLRTYVSLYTSADGRIYLSLPDLGVEKTWMQRDLTKAVEKLGEAVEEEGGDGSLLPPPLDLIVPLARKLSGSCEEQCGVQHLAILAFWYLLLGIAQKKPQLLAVKVTVCFQLPSCVGLGSSGAYCVCVAAALLQAAGLVQPPLGNASHASSATYSEPDLELIRKWAASAESLIHGRASGLDAAVCTYGGVASFKPGQRIQHFRNLPDLRVILVNSKVERNTSRMVSTVKERLKKFPDVVEGIFNSIDAISKESVKILNRPEGLRMGNGSGESMRESEASSSSPTPSSLGTPPLPAPGSIGAALGLPAGTIRRLSASSNPNELPETDHQSLQNNAEYLDAYAKLNELCRMNNQLLMGLGVGHPKIDQICTLLARYGIHPKMTGAGGGGSVYAFLKPDTSATLMDMIQDEIRKLGYELWQPPLGGAGVLLHSTRPTIFATPHKSPKFS